MMNEHEQVDRHAAATDALEAAALQALVALVEERVVENLTRVFERIARERSERGISG